MEYVKGLIRDYSITYPIYLCIDQIIENEDLLSEMKSKIIIEFLTKCDSNKIYVGIYGTDTNLCRVNDLFSRIGNFDITEYDTFLVKDET